ncbi:4'-phosphopantetheinyl transferase family protein [Flavobacterium sp.]|uniref:4'-phosphopantetheinyl transferase family protein n=1 Tax=Flavobacterium sp. TaxID=239 RepID=UPI003D6A6CC3
MTQIIYSYISEENHEYLIKNYLNGFPEDFQEKIMGFRRWQDAQLSLLGRLLLNYGLQKMNKKEKEESLSYTSYDKPFFSDSNIKFNISHSGEIVVCVLSETNEVGIDVEIMNNINIQDFESQMTKAEWNNLVIIENKAIAFFDFWTQKEAAIKANGKGLTIPLKSFEVINHHTKINDESFFLKEIFLDEKYKCHLAFKNKIDLNIVGPERVLICDL